MVHRQAKGQSAAAVEPREKNPPLVDVIAAEGVLDRVEDPLLGLVQALLVVRPTIKRRLVRRGDCDATRRTPTWFRILTSGMIRNNCRSSPPGPCSQTISG